MEAIKLTVKQNILNIKQLLINKINILLIISFCAIALITPIIFIPIEISFPIVFVISLVPINGTTFAAINFNLKKSTLNRNYNITKSNRWIFNLSTLTTMLIVTFFVTTLLLISLLFLNNLNLLLYKYGEYPPAQSIYGEITYIFNFSDYFLVIYSCILLSVVSFGVSFMVSSFIKEQRTYFGLVMIMLIFGVIFGGAFNVYFYAPINGLSFQKNPPFPTKIYWVTLLMPFGPLGQILSVVPPLAKVYIKTNGDLLWNWSQYLEPCGSWRALWFNNSLAWNITILTPYIQILIYGVVGISISKFIKNN